MRKKAMTFDVIKSEPGFNKSSLVGSAIPAEQLGEFLAKIMYVRSPDDRYIPVAPDGKVSNVTVHAHPTFWDKTEWVYDCRKEN